VRHFPGLFTIFAGTVLVGLCVFGAHYYHQDNRGGWMGLRSDYFKCPKEHPPTRHQRPGLERPTPESLWREYYQQLESRWSAWLKNPGADDIEWTVSRIKKDRESIERYKSHFLWEVEASAEDIIEGRSLWLEQWGLPGPNLDDPENTVYWDYEDELFRDWVTGLPIRFLGCETRWGPTVHDQARRRTLAWFSHRGIQPKNSTKRVGRWPFL